MAESDAQATQVDASADDQSQVDTTSGESQEDSSRDSDTLTREQAKKLRSEAANLRQRLKDAEARAQAAEKAQRDRDEAEKREQGKWEEIAKAREDELAQLKRDIAERDLRDRKTAIAKAHDLPDEFVERLKGETDEELEADAKAIAKLLKIREVPDNDAGQRTPPGNKNRDKKQFADPARWGLRQ